MSLSDETKRMIATLTPRELEVLRSRFPDMTVGPQDGAVGTNEQIEASIKRIEDRFRSKQRAQGLGRSLESGHLHPLTSDSPRARRPAGMTNLHRIADWLPGEVVVEPPAPSKLTGGLAIEPWLVSAVHERMDSHCPFDKAVSVGLMGRLWRPVSRQDAASARELSLAGTGPGQSGLAWWRSLADRDREAIVRDGLLRADDLADALEHLSSSVADDPQKARPKLIHWLHERDDLACLAFLARGTPSNDVIEVALGRLDETASTHHSIWSFVAGFDDDRLRAVASEDPDSWWGQLAAQVPG